MPPVDSALAGKVVVIPHTSMTHLAITEQQDGRAVQWMEKVTDEQFNSAPRAQSANT